MGSERVTAENVNRTLPPGVDRVAGGFRARLYIDGKRVTLGATYRTAGEAAAALAEARTDARRGDYIDRKRSTVTLDAWFAEWMPERDVRPNTLRCDQRRYRLHIKPYLGSLPLVKITPYRVGVWHARLAKDGRNPATIKKAHTLLATALGVHGAIGDRRLTVNPCAVVRPRTPQRPEWTLLTLENIERALEHLDAETACMAMVAAFAGLRWSEIAGLQRQDFNPLRATLTVQRSLTYNGSAGYDVGPTKNRRTRTVTIPARLVTALNEHLAGSDDLLIFTHQGKPVPPYRVTWRWNKACEQAGFHARFHDLRHTNASLLLQAGASLAEVRDHHGHASVTTTELYLHADRDRFAGVVSSAFG